METSAAILARRSVRAFSDQPVSRDLLRSLVEAATWAPSASNVQAWRFCVVDDPALVRKLDMVSPGLSGKPPVIVVVLSDREYARAKGGQKAADEFSSLDAAYACENLMLAAADAGLGTCAIKSYNDDAVRSLLNVPDGLQVELLISLGWPDPAKSPRAPKRKPLDEVLRFNGCETWGAEETPSHTDAAASQADDEGRTASCAEQSRDAIGAEGKARPVQTSLSEAMSASPAPQQETTQPSAVAYETAFHGSLSAAMAAASAAAGDPPHSAEEGTDGLELLAYMVTSAAGLRGEPAIYGPLRLIESSKRVAAQLADSLKTADPARAEALRNLATLIAERQNDCMTDEDSFYAMLSEAAALLAKAL